MFKAEGGLNMNKTGGGGKGAERDQEAGSVMMWQFMVSAFITNVILHHCWVAPRNPYIYEVYSKGLDEASVKRKVMFECMLCGDLFSSASQEVCLDDLGEKISEAHIVHCKKCPWCYITAKYGQNCLLMLK